MDLTPCAPTHPFHCRLGCALHGRTTRKKCTAAVPRRKTTQNAPPPLGDLAREDTDQARSKKQRHEDSQDKEEEYIYETKKKHETFAKSTNKTKIDIDIKHTYIHILATWEAKRTLVLCVCVE